MTDVKIIKDTVNVNGILNEINLIIKKYPFLKNQPQISLQTNSLNASPEERWNSATGKMKYVEGEEKDYIYPLFPELKLINHYLQSLGMYRSRIMINKSKECMTIHKDWTPRIHIPIYSNENCLMIIDKVGYYLEPGKIYWTDTRKPHTAMNGSYDYRMHIIGCVTE